MIDIFKQKKILFGVILVIVLTGAFIFTWLFIYEPGTTVVSDGSGSIAIVSGSITGLPLFTGEKDARTTFLSIINPETAAIESIQEQQGEATTYQVESSPGLKMVIVRFFDLESGAYYFGASKIVRASPGESNVTNVDMQEQRVNGDTTWWNNPKFPAPLQRLFSVISNIPLILSAFAAETAPADGAKPIVGVVGNDGFANAWVEQELAKKGFELIGLDEKMAKACDLEYDLQRRGFIDPAYHLTPTRQEPNFIVNVDLKAEKRLIYPEKSGRLERYNVTTIKVSFIDVKTGQVIAEKSSTETYKDPHDFAREIAKGFIGRVGETGPDAIEIPPFTPSEVKPLTESAVSWSERFRKIAEEAVGGVGKKEKAQPTPATAPTPSPTPTPTTAPTPICDVEGWDKCVGPQPDVYCELGEDCDRVLSWEIELYEKCGKENHCTQADIGW
ncbi:hypothetical protein A3B21_02135 [Candidatus Uhrbacteria bacterium RIFCSPLOWO2_01_FULL_47_24]|uniref:Uncharacterized protein n=1 Tax=Candidatus Uhrbacteria bacterium RIFCSPLOWO2_01_FULL_47_24 TaxID=1802401 RepID=A0A1F7UPF4_9BACT|nr:MAG: hypothetical protein A3B21_02135 [Candidatus Uhrbacteria bacterium RIFCSPLOWO2_01_FULL_47_24]OGL84938.1 MAG: hypothetical protein A3J03_04520 [Candidatus Uhrbacteria bacterium RIFCSPLOWO2_02_FULL_46_25]OGL92322.1 MAG: hypothetical protein A3H11_02270 [Candidatus Uhrbacteria bacterium RIFCSPLOWO2_12_FULL_47_10]